MKLRKHKRTKEKTCLVTAYDYPQALIADKAGVDAILVGDSCGMTTHGYKTTIPVTMDEMINHCESVSRGAKDAFLIGDMPYMSYHIDVPETLKNAAKFIQIHTNQSYQESKIEAEEIFMHVLGINKSKIYTNLSLSMTKDEHYQISRILNKRKSDIPLSYVLNKHSII